MQNYKLSVWKGYHLSIEGILKGYHFCQKWQGWRVGPRGRASLACINFVEYPLTGGLLLLISREKLRKKEKTSYYHSMPRSHHASRRYSLKNKLGDRMIKQLLNSVIAKYRDLSVSRRSIICLSLRRLTHASEKSPWHIETHAKYVIRTVIIIIIIVLK